MKKNQLLIVVLILFSTMVFSQEMDNITGKFYITDVDIVCTEYDIVNRAPLPTKYVAKKNTKFTVYEIINGKLLVKFWDYNTKKKNITKDTQIQPNQNLNPTEYKYISSETNGNYFLLDLEDYNKKTAEYYGTKHSVIWGFSTLPIKMRFRQENVPFTYETGFSLGINAGYECQLKSRTNQSIGILLGIGVSTLPVTPETVNNYIDKSTTVGAFTPSLGLVYSYETFQFGLFSGYDIIPGNLGENWVYRNRPWLGIGLGFTIFQKNKTTSATSQEQ